MTKQIARSFASAIDDRQNFLLLRLQLACHHFDPCWAKFVSSLADDSVDAIPPLISLSVVSLPVIDEGFRPCLESCCCKMSQDKVLILLFLTSIEDVDAVEQEPSCYIMKISDAVPLKGKQLEFKALRCLVFCKHTIKIEGFFLKKDFKCFPNYKPPQEFHKIPI